MQFQQTHFKYSFNRHISVLVSTLAFQLQFQHTHFSYSFHTHISSNITLFVSGNSCACSSLPKELLLSSSGFLDLHLENKTSLEAAARNFDDVFCFVDTFDRILVREDLGCDTNYLRCRTYISSTVS